MLMGLIGYTADEVRRRSKEIAIRKVNGAEASSILELLSKDILVVALPAVISRKPRVMVHQRRLDGTVCRADSSRLDCIPAGDNRQSGGNSRLCSLEILADSQRKSGEQY